MESLQIRSRGLGGSRKGENYFYNDKTDNCQAYTRKFGEYVKDIFIFFQSMFRSNVTKNNCNSSFNNLLLGKLEMKLSTLLNTKIAFYLLSISSIEIAILNHYF